MNENNVIMIPAVAGNSNVGRVFNNLFQISISTEFTDGDEAVWDFGNVENLHPFFVSLLALVYARSQKMINCINICDALHRYLEEVHFFNPLNISQQNIGDLDKYENQLFIPNSDFLANDDNIQTRLQRIIVVQKNIRVLLNPLSYMLSELICNVTQHSQSDIVHFFSQYSDEDNCLYISIIDDGIGIYGSYANAQKLLDEIGNDETIALMKASLGYSTKDRPGAESRGFGITTTRKMLVEGMGGEYFILSGDAFYRSSNGAPEVYANLPKEFYWQGTTVLLKIPCSIRENFNYINYLE